MDRVGHGEEGSDLKMKHN